LKSHNETVIEASYRNECSKPVLKTVPKSVTGDLSGPRGTYSSLAPPKE